MGERGQDDRNCNHNGLNLVVGLVGGNRVELPHYIPEELDSDARHPVAPPDRYTEDTVAPIKSKHNTKHNKSNMRIK